MAKRQQRLKLTEYCRQLEGKLRTGQAGEPTHYPTLQDLLKAFAPDCVFLCEPRRTEVGAPDFLVLRDDITIGYVEAKNVGASLDEAEKSEQLKRYRRNLPVRNLILSNYLEFRWYVDGTYRDGARVATKDERGRVKTTSTARQQLTSLLQGFFAEEPPVLGRADDLAQWLARAAHEIREVIQRSYEQEHEGDSLHQQLEALRTTLIPDLSPELFADTYAQTIAYGLFAARYEVDIGRGFTRHRAAELLGHINPFLRDLFNNIAGPGLDPRIAWLVDNIAELLSRADMSEILKEFGREKGRKDPVVHFYETFLKAYDPRTRRTRGVYYTPREVVSYIVRSIDRLLQTKFGLPEGLAHESVLILDPACGTGTFLYEVIQLIHQRFAERNDLGRWPAYVREKLLPRLFGFELLMAPYIICHLKLAVCLRETKASLGRDERFQVFLTNALEPEVHGQLLFPFAQAIVEEGRAATEVKKVKPIMVVLGNPPYSVSSYNKGPWIEELMDDYKRDVRSERNIQPLSDDYIKFIRFAHWRISEQTRHGIVGMITNHSYLSGLIHRGVRRRLLEAFDEIYVLDLHGNVAMKELPPGGMKDQNVFDIQQGVAISLFAKLHQPEPKEGPQAELRHAELWGDRDGKYAQLASSDVSTTPWSELPTADPHYWFVPKDLRLQAEYDQGWSVAEALPVNSRAVATHADALLVDFSQEVLRERMQAVRCSTSLEQLAASLPSVGGKYFSLSKLREVLQKGDPHDPIQQVLYRPFDVRYMYYHRGVVVRDRWAVMQHMLAGRNVALLVMRQVALGEVYSHVGLCKLIADNRAFYSNRGHMSVHPLYLYDDEGRRANLAPEFVKEFAKRLGSEFVDDGRGASEATFGPKDVLDYVYAVLHSPTYRKRYEEFLKIDFPRIPLTSSKGLFRALVRLGSELVALHLLEADIFKDPKNFITCFPEPGSNEVGRVRYDDKNQRVHVNKTQYIQGVPKDIWEFHVGGYQVLQKWLKDRGPKRGQPGRTLTDDDITHYHKVVLALSETIRAMAEIDAAIPSWPIQ